MCDLIAAIAVQAEGGNHLLLPVAHLRYLRMHQGLLRALRHGIEQDDFFNVSELVHDLGNAEHHAGLSRICTAACERCSIRGKYGNWLGPIPRKASGRPARKHGSLLLYSQVRYSPCDRGIAKADEIHGCGSLRIGEVTALRCERIHSDRIEIVERFYEGEFDDTKTDAGRGASRLIPPEFCVVRWMQLGSAQSIAIRGSYNSFHFPCCPPSLRAGRLYCVG
jgi:hypothetical protein